MSEIGLLSDEELLSLSGSTTTPETRDIASLSDTELSAISQQNQPGPVTGFLDTFNESVADLAGLPGTLLFEGAKAVGVAQPISDAVNFVIRNVGLPELTGDPILTSSGLKNLFTELGITSGLEFNERTEAGKIGARAGQIVGLAAPITTATGIAARGVNLTKGMLAGFNPTAVQKIIESAARFPKTFFTTEAGAITGAATGAAFSEAAFPGNDTALFINEILGTLINPAGQVVKVASSTGKSIKRAASSFSRGAKEDQASDVLKALIEETGEDIPALIKLLDEADTLTLTPGLKTSSPALLALEQKLVKTNPKFAEKVKGIQKSAFSDLREIVDNFAASGDPQLLRVAAKLRGRYFDDLIGSRINAAKREASEATARITAPGFKSSASANVQAIHEQAIKDLRKVESGFWDKIPQNLPVIPNNLKKGFAEAKAELLQEESLPLGSEILRVIERFTTKGATSGEMLKLRSRALTESRKLRSEGKFREARLTDTIASSTLDDISELGLDSVANAREFSTKLHDKFLNTFAGDIIQKGKSGAERISPELVLERAFGSGGTQGRIRMNDLVDAGKFADNSVLTPIIGDAVRNEEERFLRMVASETIEDGIVNASKLERFKANNAQLLERFPQLEKQLSTAGNATRALQRTEQLTGQANKAILRKSAFAQLAGVENPTVLVKQILDGKNPAADYQKLAKFAKRGGPGATAGLRTSTIDNAVAQSTTANGLSFVKLRDNLMADARGEQSVFSLMKKNGVMDKSFSDDMTKLLNRAADIEKSALTSRELGELLDDPDQFFDLMVRIVGANVGGASALASSSGAGLVIAGATVRTFRNLLEKVPASRVVDILIEASENPAVMSQILKRVKTPQQAEKVAIQLRAPLIAAGIIAADEG